MKWQSMETAPRNGHLFWLGTTLGGVMLESWHFCDGEFKGCYSRTTIKMLQIQDPKVICLWTEMQAPEVTK